MAPGALSIVAALLIALGGTLGGCASVSSDHHHPCCSSTEVDRARAARDARGRHPSRVDISGDHWVHDARERVLAAHRPFWREPRLTAELGLEAAQITRFDRAFEAALAARHAERTAERSATQRRTAALASADWDGAKRANRQLAHALARLAVLDAELKIEIFSGLREEQRRKLAEFHPGLVDGSWLPPEIP